ncbi:hypothetical protein RCL1_004006 [Eukaryota sp. TZLM3-RCL]
MLNQNAQKHLELALQSLDNALHEDAFININKALFFSPKEPSLLLFRAHLYFDLLDFRPCISCCKLLLQLPDLHSNILHRANSFLARSYETLALNALQCNKLTEAHSLLSECLSISLTSKLLLLFTICTVSLPPPVPLSSLPCLFSQFSSHHPTPDADFLSALAVFDLYSGKQFTALSHAHRALSLSPSHSVSLHVSSIIQSDVETIIREALECRETNPDQCLLLLNQAVDTSPLHKRARYERSLILIERSKFQEAVNDLKVIIGNGAGENNFPDDVEIIKKGGIKFTEVLKILAEFSQKDGDFSKALHYLTIALKVENFERNFDLLVFKGDVLSQLNRHDDAINDWILALSVNQDDWQLKTKISIAYYNIGIDYLNKQNFPKADTSFSKSIEFNPKISAVYVIRSKTRLFLNQGREALNDVRKALSLDPKNLEAVDLIQQMDPNFVADGALFR